MTTQDPTPWPDKHIADDFIEALDDAIFTTAAAGAPKADPITADMVAEVTDWYATYNEGGPYVVGSGDTGTELDLIARRRLRTRAGEGVMSEIVITDEAVEAGAKAWWEGEGRAGSPWDWAMLNELDPYKAGVYRREVRAIAESAAPHLQVMVDREALGEAWDDGNATGLDGYVGPNRGAGDVDPEAEYARERVINKLTETPALSSSREGKS